MRDKTSKTKAPRGKHKGGGPNEPIDGVYYNNIKPIKIIRYEVEVAVKIRKKDDVDEGSN
jgi:hypothetical protein